MIEKGKISGLQLTLMMYLMIGATAILIVPALSARDAHQDVWLSPVWGSISGFAAVFLIWILNRMYPNRTIVEQSQLIFGRFLGSAVNIVLLLFILHTCSLILREYGEFIVGSSLVLTPITVVMGCIALVSAIAVRGGVEVLGRFATIVTPVFVFFVLAISIFLIPSMNIDNMLPAFEHGLMPSIKGSITPHAWFMEFLILSFFVPYVKKKERKIRFAIIAVFAMLITMVITNITCLLLFGDMTGNMTFPVFIASRYISFAEFFEHVEAMVMVLWMLGGFLQITLWFYALALGTAQCLRLSDYRPVVLPFGLLLTAVAVWVSPSLQHLIRFFSIVAFIYSFSILIILPLLLIIIGFVRRKWLKQQIN